MADKPLDNTIENKAKLKNQLDDAFGKEMKLFEDFYQGITHRAKTHRQIALNQLSDVEDRLTQLKDKAKDLKSSFFFHEEYEIVDRQEIIASTEQGVEKRNRDFLSFHYHEKDELLQSLDYLSKALIQVKNDFFDQYSHLYLSTVYQNENLFEYIDRQNIKYNDILNQNQEEIMSIFYRLDEEIRKMDEEISTIIQKKNRQVAIINSFYDQEMKHFIDNQLLFSVEEDPMSVDLQALISDKIRQFETLKSHMEEQDQKFVKRIQTDYQVLFQSIYERSLKKHSNLMVSNLTFFDNPKAHLQRLKQEIVQAKDENNQAALKEKITTYERAKKYQQIQTKERSKVLSMLKKTEREKKGILEEFRLENESILSDLERYLRLYQTLMNSDPFLAQVMGDISSQIIKDELNRLSILQVNKELKTNINFDIASQKIKAKINELEMELANEVKVHMINQEEQLLNVYKDMQKHFLDNAIGVFFHLQEGKKYALTIDRLKTAIIRHLRYLLEKGDITRKIAMLSTKEGVNATRLDETHHIHVAAAASKIKLALKEYDIQSLHFKTMMENENSYLVMQSQRVSEESLIHNEFILTTFENQMRFASEQVELAKSEFAVRVEALQNAIDEEKRYFDDMIFQRVRKIDEQKKRLEDEYQSGLYQNQRLLSQSVDDKMTKSLEKQSKAMKKAHDSALEKLNLELAKDEVVRKARLRLDELDLEFVDAVDDAVNLRDETISQMSSIYDDAHARYEALKPYLDNKINVLDPDFFHAIERMNERYLYRLKLAEATLDEATKEHLDEYRKIFFEEVAQTSQLPYVDMMKELEEKGSSLKLVYETDMAKIEEDYHVARNNLDMETDVFEKNANAMKAAMDDRYRNSSSELNLEMETLKEKYTTDLALHRKKAKDEVFDLTNEYEEALDANEKYINTLTEDFKRLVALYQPYVKLSKKNKVVREVFRESKRRYSRLSKASVKSIHKKTMQIDMLGSKKE